MTTLHSMMSTSSPKHVSSSRSTSPKHSFLDALHVEWAFTHEHTFESLHTACTFTANSAVSVARLQNPSMHRSQQSRVMKRERKVGTRRKEVASSRTITWLTLTETRHRYDVQGGSLRGERSLVENKKVMTASKWREDRRVKKEVS